MPDQEYVDRNLLKQALFITTDEWDQYLDHLIKSAARAIDVHTGQNFDDIASEIRFFNSQGGQSIGIDELQVASLVQVDTDRDGVFDSPIVEGTDFEFQPLNTSPKTTLVLRNDAILGPLGAVAQFPDGQKTVEITATWGYETVPDLVAQATLMTVSRWFKRRDATYTEVTAGGGSNVLDPDVVAMLEEFRAESSGKLEIIFP